MPDKIDKEQLELAFSVEFLLSHNQGHDRVCRTLPVDSGESQGHGYIHIQQRALAGIRHLEIPLKIKCKIPIQNLLLHVCKHIFFIVEAESIF